ncbi:MAG: FHA domain-containing protein [Deltaproteobacteria bacterium]|nr:FHA domain-containing protein [Deltaproteobacteria bacterium]
METEAVLKEFDEHVEQYAQHRHFIEKARAHSKGFTPAVVEKVIYDHEVQASAIADRILPLIPGIQEALAGLEARTRELEKARSEVDERMQELQLRQVIGEMDDRAFEKASKDLKGEIEQAGGSLDALRGDRDALTRSLERWVQLASDAAQPTGLEEGLAASLDDDGSQVEVVEDQDDGQHVVRGGFVEDVSPVFAEPLPPREEADVVEFDEVDVGTEDDEDGDLAILGEGGEAVDVAEAIEISPDAPAEAATDHRQALLLYQEGTPEEQIYPFTGDVLTIGRGRDNDIQIKNDSKVSRYHCKLFRRGANFYIEDNKSSNGTMVGGDLVSERRLLGGEQILIGETFFRFRIMD